MRAVTDKVSKNVLSVFFVLRGIPGVHKIETEVHMAKPIVAIVGRPNVGKSTLFNMLVGERLSIVKDTPGVTRDRIYADVNWLNYHFTLDGYRVESSQRQTIRCSAI